MSSLKTNAVIHSRDIIWLHKMHKDWIKKKSTTMINSEDDVIELPTGKGFLIKMKIMRSTLKSQKMTSLKRMKRYFVR